MGEIKEFLKDYGKRIKYVFVSWWRAKWYEKPFVLAKNYWLYLIFDKPLPKKPEEPFDEFLIPLENEFPVFNDKI